MRSSVANRSGLLATILVSMLAAATLPSPTPAEDTLMDLQRLVPAHHGQWQKTGDDGLYDHESIFKYMNGAGEVFLSFAFQSLLVRRFQRAGEEELTVELYDMGTPADAFGVFSRNLQTEEVGVGQGSEYRSGFLSFWQDRYFATVFAAQESPDSRDAVFGLAATIAAGIPGSGQLPALVRALPQANLLPRSTRYFHLYTDLNQHYFVADENILGLDRQTEAVIANYEREGGFLYLLVIRYPDHARATSAFDGFLAIYLPEAREKGVARLEDGSWVAATRRIDRILIVFDATTAASAEALLAEAQANLEGEEQ